MRNPRLTLLAVAMLALGPAWAAPADEGVTTPGPATAAPDPNTPADPDRDCRPLTLAKGEHSGFGGLRPGFLGADLVIRDPLAWQAFWAEHTAPLDPPPPLPPVDFRQHVVLAVVQGPQTSGGGPNIAILGVHPRGPFISVVVFDDERPGPLDVITNPFHIVVVERTCVPPHASLVFEHVAPQPGTGVIVGRVLAAGSDAPPRPLPGAQVSLMSTGAPPGPPVAVSGRDGSYFFVNVRPGAYALHAEARGFEPANEPIHVPPDALVHRDLVLTPLPVEPGAIAGFVLHPADGGPAPLPGALLELVHDGVVVRTTESNDIGFYEFLDVAPGPYVLRARHPAYIPQAVETVVPPGETVTHIFILEPRPQGTGVLTGVVRGVNPDGTVVPLPEAGVALLAPEGVVRHTLTNRLGEYTMRDVPAGHYRAIAGKRGWLAAQAEVDILPNAVTRQDFVLEPAPQLQSQPDDSLAPQVEAAPEEEQAAALIDL